MKSLLQGLVAVLSLMAMSCLSDRSTGNLADGGDATETGNARILGRLLDESGQPIASAQVTAYDPEHDASHDSVLSRHQKTVSDAEGWFAFDSLPEGTWSLEARSGLRGLSALFHSLKLGASKMKLAAEVLHSPGSLAVQLEDSLAFETGSYVYAPGTSAFAPINEEARQARRIVLFGIPSGILPKVYLAAPSKVLGQPIRRTLLAESVQVAKATQGQVGAFSSWSHSLRYKIVADSTGMGLKQALVGFSLPLRLASPSFDFKSARPDGGDLRVTTSEGQVLPFTIEQFDPVAGLGVLWVRLDTLRPNHSGHSLFVHYGRPEATLPKYPTVFDTADGYGGVWHLNEENPGVAHVGLYRDATPLHADGNDLIRNTGRAGVIGYGKSFADSDYIEIPTLRPKQKPDRAFTLTAWIRCTGVGPNGGEIISMGDNFGLRLMPNGQLHTFVWPPVNRTDSSVAWYPLTSTDLNFKDGTWHHVGVTFDGSNLTIFADGKQVIETKVSTQIGYNQASHITLGRHGNQKTTFNFIGDMDEVAMHWVKRSPEWIRAAYESQRVNGQLLQAAP